MQKRLTTPALLVAAACLVSAGSARAAVTLASDSADNAAYTTFGGVNGMNGGSGFTAWSVVSTGAATNGGSFINSGSYDATGLPGRVFDLYENGNGALNSGVTTATRGFATPLVPGATFAFTDVLHFANGTDVNGNATSSLGFSLQNAGGTNLLTLAVGGGTAGYSLTDANRTGAVQTNIPYNYQTAFTFAFTLNDAAGGYTLNVAGGGLPSGGVNVSGSINVASGLPSAVAIFNNDGGFSSDVQFSNLSITAVPEPTGLLSALVLTPLLRRRSR